ncbi:hypothetical protein GCM10010174_31240 [Kutzneria viridogrisea]
MLSEYFLVAVYLVVIAVPGLLLGFAGGLRGWLLAGAAPLLTYGVVGVFGPLLPKFGIDWSPVTLALSTAVLAALVFGISTVLRGRFEVAEQRAPWRLVDHLGVLAALAVAGLVGLFAVKRASNGFTLVPQWWDAGYHANAIRFIADTGNSLPSALKVLSHPDVSSYYYPNAYHVLAATVRQLTGADVVALLDISNGVVVGLFALASIVMVRQFSNSPALCAAAGVLSCAVTSFPYDVIVWGPIFPFVAGVAFIPAFFAVFGRMLDTRSAGALLLTAVTMVGLLAVHLSIALAAFVIGLFLLAQRWITNRRTALPDLALLGVLGLAAVLVGAFQFSAILQTVANAGDVLWPATYSPGDAVGRLLTSSKSRDLPQWWFTALLLLGLIGLHKAKFRSMLWWLLGGLAFTGLTVLDAGYNTTLSHVLNSPWWNDSWRLAAIATLGLIGLAAIGLVTLRDALISLLGKVSAGLKDRPALTGPVAVGLVLVLLGLLTHGLYLGRNTDRLRDLWRDGPVVDNTKIQALHWMHDNIPQGAVVANDSHDGSTWMWAIDGVRPLFGSAQIGPQEQTADGLNRTTVLDRLNELDGNPEVRKALQQLKVRYVFVGEGSVDGAGGRAKGFRDLEQVRSLRPIFHNARATVYQLAD